MRSLLSVAVFCLAALPAVTATPAIAAPHEWHECPTEARGNVTHNADASWVATTQSSRLLDTRISPIGGIASLVCVYQMFGGEYWIYKRPSPSYMNCQLRTLSDGRRGFYCTP